MLVEIDYSKMIGEGGHYLTQALFYEFRFQTKSDYIPYTLRERDTATCRSAYRIYMDCNSEYEAAMKLFNSWKHWLSFCESPVFAKEVEKWREERAIKEAAIGKAVLIKEAEKGNAAAAKALIEYSNTRKAGRPSKLEVESEKKRQAAIDNKVSNILSRMSNK